VTYNDGSLVQTQTVPVTGADTNVELDYAPYVTVPASTTSSTPDGPVAVPVGASESLTSTALTLSSLHGKAGVQISLIPPSGAKVSVPGRCTAQLTGKTDNRGKVSLRVCATKSGLFKVKSKGAVPVGAFMLLVKGKPALPPRALTGKSPKPGQARVSWSRPAFTGGATVTSYKVTFAARGKATVTSTLKVGATTPLLVKVSGLAHATRYTATVQAITKYGISDSASTSVSVA
jgi:hypothetical protein